MKKRIVGAFIAVIMAITAITPITAFAGEQLGENTFESGSGIPWHICESGPAKLDFDIDGGSYNITINNPGGLARGGDSRWDCQFRHRGIKIVQGHQYRVKFEVTASNSGQIYAKIGNTGGDVEVWHNGSYDNGSWENTFYSTYEPLRITANQTYKCDCTFTASESVDVAEFAFHFGGAGREQPTDCFPVGTKLVFDNLYLTDLTSNENDFVHEAPYERNEILVNQLGYYPALTKVATMAVAEYDMTPKTFYVYNASGQAVYKANSKPAGYDKDSGDWVHKLDFTEFNRIGKGYYLVCGNAKSYPFDISNDIYDHLVTDGMNYFYQNRSAIEILPQYITSGDPNTLKRPAGHTKDIAYIQPEWKNAYLSDASDVITTNPQDVTGGWYDAGDYGKYVVNGGISVWTLNNIYERSLFEGDASKWDDNSGTVIIPENGNGIPDILDETRYEMEWFFTMLVKDGDCKNMVYHKVHDSRWTGLAVKSWDYEEEWQTKRIIKPASTAATLNFVACAAQSYRLWKDIDPVFANKCLDQARLSYSAAKAHPAMYAPNDQSIGGGPYGDDHLSDDFYWAACELYAATGSDVYYNDLKAYEDAFKVVPNLYGGENNGSCTSFNWGNTGSLGSISLYLNCEGQIADDEYQQIIDSITSSADFYMGIENKQGYGIPYQSAVFTDLVNLGVGVEVEGYEWGSNSMVVNNAIVMAYAYDVSGNKKYASGAAAAMNYIFGTNPLDFSFVTGYGEHACKYPHHRWWSNQLDESFPLAPSGALSGGCNSGLQDPYARGSGYKRGEVSPQICYIDNVESWSTNEVTINWNSPLVWITSWLEDNASAISYKAYSGPETVTIEDLPVDTDIIDSEEDSEEDSEPISDSDSEPDINVTDKKFKAVLYDGNAPLNSDTVYTCLQKAIFSAKAGDEIIFVTSSSGANAQVKLSAKIGEDDEQFDVYGNIALKGEQTTVTLGSYEASCIAISNSLHFAGENATITKIVYASDRPIFAEPYENGDTNEDTDTPDFVLGDINGDGVLDILDVVIARSHVVGNSIIFDTTKGDMNKDKNIDIIDIALMRSAIVE